jgi:hypothetical protein
LLGAASGYVYASLGAQQLPTVIPYLTAQAESRMSETFQEAQELVGDNRLNANIMWYEARNLMNQELRREEAAVHSIVVLTGATADADSEQMKALRDQAATFNRWIDEAAQRRGASGNAPTSPWANSAAAKRVPVRIGEFGPLTYQNDNVLLARLGVERYRKIKLLDGDASHLLKTQDLSELYGYEIVNFVNGQRTLGEIRDAVAAEYGPLSIELVADYLDACAEAKVIRWK